MNDYRELKYIFDQARSNPMFWKVEHLPDGDMQVTPLLTEEDADYLGVGRLLLYSEDSFLRWKSDSTLTLIFSEKEYFALRLKYSDVIC